MRDFTKPLPDIQEDMHIHSTFSDGKNTPAENAAAAYLIGLEKVCMVDHVRRDSTWVPRFSQTISELKCTYEGRMAIYSGVEAKIINEDGILDIPDNMSGVDYILVADHQFPLGNRFVSPDAVTRMLDSGKMSPEEVATRLIDATLAVMQQYKKLILSHLFSLLPKVGLVEACIPYPKLEQLAACAADTNTIVEINERWQCPSFSVVECLLNYGVELVYGSDAHSKEAVGRYAYLTKVKTAVEKYTTIAPVLVPA